MISSTTASTKSLEGMQGSQGRMWSLKSSASLTPSAILVHFPHLGARRPEKVLDAADGVHWDSSLLQNSSFSVGKLH